MVHVDTSVNWLRIYHTSLVKLLKAIKLASVSNY